MTDDRSVHFTRFNLTAQVERVRNRDRPITPINWASSRAAVSAAVGNVFPLNRAGTRELAVVRQVDVPRSRTTQVAHTCFQIGIMDRTMKPHGWKVGDDEPVQVELGGGRYWIHPAWFAIPHSGNHLVLQHTQSGPHIGDVKRWLAKVLQVHLINDEVVPVGDFYDELERNGASFREFTLSFRPRLDTAAPSHSVISEESKIANGFGNPGSINITIKARRGAGMEGVPLLRRIARWLGGRQGVERYDGDYLELEDVVAVPRGHGHVGDGAESPTTAAISLMNNVRATYDVTLVNGSLSKEAIMRCLDAELKAWLTARGGGDAA